MTPDEWRVWERLNGTQDNEEEWLACPVADCLLDRLLALGVSERKQRLFGCACCRLVWHYLVHPESKAAVEAAERFAVGEISAEEMQDAADAALAPISGPNPGPSRDKACREIWLEYLAAVSAEELARAENEGGWPYWERLVEIPRTVLLVGANQPFGLDEAAMEVAMIDRLRDIVGNPYRAVTVAPEWRTSTVLGLAQRILSERAYERLPFLADALEEAGCAEAELLAHCRGSQDHQLGCWAVDSLLGFDWRSAEPGSSAIQQ